MATWRSGYAAVCKTVYPGSIPGVASNKIKDLGEKRQAPENTCQCFVSRKPAGARFTRPVSTIAAEI